MAPASKRMRSGAVLNSTLLLGCDVSTPLPKSSKSKRFRAKEESKKQLDEHFWDTSINNSPHNSSLGHDLIELFCEPRTGTKSKSPKRKKNKLKHVQSFDLDLLDRPMTTKSVGGRSNIEGVFDEFLKKDPFASLGKFVLTERQPSPDRPLTLFSPVKDQPRTFSAPQNRVPEEGRLKATESHIERWTSKAVASAKRELILDGRSPLYRRRLDAAAYSPCPNSKAMSGRKIDAWSCMNGPAEWSTCSPQPSISTPVAQSRLFKTPSAPKCQSIPGEPLSGVKSLFQEESFFAESPISIAGTPRHFDSSHPSFMSPAYVERPDSVKQTLLLGVTCYVEVKYNKEDRSESIRKEVISLGAKVEKNFTKRVTHVIFKGGKMSTYIKAKEMKIPIVSLLWLEACKVVGNMVDPEIYPPADNVEYEKNVPIEEDKKRERFLRRGQAFLDRLNGVLPVKPPRTRSNKKKAVTEGKKKSPRITAKIVGARRKMPKKLNFNPSSGNRRVNDSDSDYESETDCDVNNDACRDKPERRKSAPATLGDVEKPTDGKQRTANAEIEKDGFETPTRRREQKTQEDLLKILTGGGVTAEKRRRKLFDPNESLMSQPLLATPEDMSPYLKPSPARSKSRTTSSKRSQKVKELKRLGGARKSLAPLIEHEEESLSVSTSRNSLGCFELDKKTKYSTKDRPRIAFTGLPKDEIARFKKIVSRLGSFEIDSTVSKKTTHLVTLSKPVVRRTINLLKALARGCWILDVEWLNHSDDSNKWMSEEPFELKSFSEAVVQCRLEKQAFGKHYAMDLFSGFGSIFVDSSAQAPRSDLIELIKICSGKVVNVSSKADIIVSSRPLDDSNPEVTFVSHLWVLDSITKNKVLDVEQYKIPLCFVQPSA